MNEIIIAAYNYTPKEFNQIQRLCKGFPYFDYYLEFFQDKYYRVFLAWEPSVQTLLGVIVASRHSFNLYGDFLWVDASVRRQGVGIALVRHLEEIARQEGFRSVIGETPETDMEAQNLYEKFGGEKIGTILPLYDDPFRLIVYRKKIRENMDKKRES